MFIECRQSIMSIPKSSDTSIIFPFRLCPFQFRCDPKDYRLVEERLSAAKIQEHLKSFHDVCRNFKGLKVIRIIFALMLLATLACVVVGSVFINLGLQNKLAPFFNLSDDNHIISLSNEKIKVGGALLGFSLVTFFILLIVLIIKNRKLRIYYEDRIFPVMTKINSELHDLGLRWRLGNQLRWIELSIDYKKNDTYAPTQLLFNASSVSLAPMVSNMV